jgi:hypothetical protein
MNYFYSHAVSKKACSKSDSDKFLDEVFDGPVCQRFSIFKTYTVGGSEGRCAFHKVIQGRTLTG